jgi:putative ABC transport system permease protein
MIFWRILSESFQFALHALVVNKLRTLLSLLGVTIGILTMVSVFTVFDSLENSIRGSVQQLGSSVIYVQKWPWGGGEGGDYPWWKYYQRPEPNPQELEVLRRKMTKAEALSYFFTLSQTLKFKLNSVEGVTVNSVSDQYFKITEYDLEKGRLFNSNDHRSGKPVIVLGHDVAQGLFPMGNALGKETTILGRRLRIIGVLKKQGQSLVGANADASAFVPVNYLARLMSLNNQNNSSIMAKAASEEQMPALRDELTGALRSIRRIKPKDEDNFALNEISVISSGLDTMFSIIGIAGSVIAGFSILVGGFGIANIMFVSVKERTNQIGIQKSLGAKSYFILTQFLAESVFLCLLGGAVGIAIVAILVPPLSKAWDFEVNLTIVNMVRGLGISVLIGVLSGFIPAFQASRLNPVEAIRQGV